MPIDFSQISELLVSIAQNDIAELTLKSDDFELIVRKEVSAPKEGGSSAGITSEMAAIPTPIPPQPKPPGSENVAPNAASPPVDKKWVEFLPQW